MDFLRIIFVTMFCGLIGYFSPPYDQIKDATVLKRAKSMFIPTLKALGVSLSALLLFLMVFLFVGNFFGMV